MDGRQDSGRELRPEKPCPVCGSLEHPSPSVVSELHENLTVEILEAKAEEITKACRETGEEKLLRLDQPQISEQYVTERSTI